MGGAILLGSAVGGGVTVWANAQRRAAVVDAQPTPVATVHDVPVHEGPAPEPTGPLQAAQRSDDAIAPQSLVILDNSTSLTVSWSDPTNGGVTFVVLDPDQVNEQGDPGVALKLTDPGVTQVTIEGVDPNAPQVCLQVVALDLADANHFGRSERKCVEDRASTTSG